MKTISGKVVPSVQALPDAATDFLYMVGGITRFSWKFFTEGPKPPYEWKEVAKQVYNAGNKTFLLVGITAFIMGVVITLQTRPTLIEFGAVAWLPQAVSVSIIREIGPVITALICAGKVGSGIGAELGSMKVTEQIDAMEVSGTRPFNYLVVTRVTATTLMIPILVFYADAIAIFGSYIAANAGDMVHWRLFYKQSLDVLAFSDVIPATIKTFFFGFAIGIVSSYMGYTTKKGTEGVGKAANASVVMASLLIFIIDAIAVQLTQLFI